MKCTGAANSKPKLNGMQPHIFICALTSFLIKKLLFDIFEMLSCNFPNANTSAVRAKREMYNYNYLCRCQIESLCSTMRRNKVSSCPSMKKSFNIKEHSEGNKQK